MAIADKIVSPQPVLIGELGILKVFAEAGNEYGGDAFLSALESLGNASQQFSGTVKRVLRSIYPPAGGADFADPQIRDQLDSFAANGLLDTTAVATIKASVLVSPTITAADVSQACKPYRTNNACGSSNWTGA
jgi:hypothetical protein